MLLKMNFPIAPSTTHIHVDNPPHTNPAVCPGHRTGLGANPDRAQVAAGIDAGCADPMWTVLREIGELRKNREQSRGGVSVSLPEQEIREDNGQWVVEFRSLLAIEDWNEQISLLTGMAAAHLMMQAKVGILRTLPDPDPAAIARLRRTASALAIAWPDAQTYPEVIRRATLRGHDCRSCAERSAPRRGHAARSGDRSADCKRGQSAAGGGDQGQAGRRRSGRVNDPFRAGLIAPRFGTHGRSRTIVPIA